MAEFKAGDRVVKMSGTGAGKYGTVNSVMENGTLNVTFDGERLPKYCDPTRCGQVAANATKSRLKGFKVGDKVKDRHGNVGIVEKIQTDDAGPFGPPPSKYGDLLGIKIDGGRIGWLNETNAVLVNSRAANAHAFDKGGRPVKEGDTIDTPKGMAEVVAIKMRPQGLREVASYVGVTYTPGGRRVDEWLMADVHGTVRATLQNAARNALEPRTGDAKKIEDALNVVRDALRKAHAIVRGVGREDIASLVLKAAETTNRARF